MPTAGKIILRVFFTVVASLGWRVKTDDESAFSLGNSLERVVYVKPPREANVREGVIWRLLSVVCMDWRMPQDNFTNKFRRKC